MHIERSSCYHRSAHAYADEGVKSGRVHDRHHRGRHEDERAGQAEHRRGGGISRMADAVAQALKSLGLAGKATDTAAAPAATSTQDAKPVAAPDAERKVGDANEGTRGSRHQIRHDLHHFMHALFDAIRGTPAGPGKSAATNASATAAANSPVIAAAKASTPAVAAPATAATAKPPVTTAPAAAATTAAATAAAPAAAPAKAAEAAPTATGQAAVRAYGGDALGSGLAALIARVAAGSAPSGLQEAFDRLLSHLQPAPAAPVDPTTAPTSAITLETFLTKLQDVLAIVMPHHAATSGALVDTTA